MHPAQRLGQIHPQAFAIDQCCDSRWAYSVQARPIRPRNRSKPPDDLFLEALRIEAANAMQHHTAAIGYGTILAGPDQMFANRKDRTGGPAAEQSTANRIVGKRHPLSIEPFGMKDVQSRIGCVIVEGAEQVPATVVVQNGGVHRLSAREPWCRRNEIIADSVPDRYGTGLPTFRGKPQSTFVVPEWCWVG